MSKKSPKIASLLAQITDHSFSKNYDPHYIGFFHCFNQQLFYEAHDILENLWLKTKGPDHFYFKGLIQLAGAFVHLQKSKLNPASRLFLLAFKNLEPYSPFKMGLHVQAVLKNIKLWNTQLENSQFTQNPFDPQKPPQLELKNLD